MGRFFMNKLEKYCRINGHNYEQEIKNAINLYIDSVQALHLTIDDSHIKKIIDSHYGCDTMQPGKDGAKPKFRHINRYILFKYKYINDYAKVAKLHNLHRCTCYHSEK